MRLGKSLLRRRWVQQALGSAFAGWFGLVHRSVRRTAEPADLAAVFAANAPAICAMWHGQHFMVPFAAPPGVRFAVMIARNAEAGVNAVAVERLGMTAIRASGSRRQKDIRRKGGLAGFIEALRALKDGSCVSMTADVPVGPARVSGRGIILLARHSGRPILPVAYATRHAVVLSSWDRASVNLPFGRAGVVVGEPLEVPADADEETVEVCRRELEVRLDAVNARAAALAGARPHPLLGLDRPALGGGDG